MKTREIFSISIVLAIVALLASTVPTFAAAGTGPDDALTPAGDWQPLNPGKSLWYGFHYTGDGSQIQVRLEVVPSEGATFDVWTPEGIERRGLGLEAEPIGRGSVDRAGEGKLVWNGSFNDEGNYYVVVDHSGSQPGTSHYLLTIEGDGVSLPSAEGSAASPPATTATPEPKAASPSEPTGKLAFQTSMGGNIYSISVDGTDLRRITDGMDPVWSPDGEQIAFTRWRDPRGVWVVDFDGTDEQRVFDWSEARYPSWSPDGEQIVFSRKHGGTSGREICFRGRCFTIPPTTFWHLGIVDVADGTFAEPLPNSDASLTPDWSPGGEKVVYDAVQGLQVQSVDGQVSYQITGDARDTSPVWSPDGDQVAFVRRQHDHWEIYMVGADGSNPRRLTDTPDRPDGTPGSSASPAWSPDGNYIAFLTDRTGKWEIWVITADGTGPRPMFESALDNLTLDYASLGERAISWTQ